MMNEIDLNKLKVQMIKSANDKAEKYISENELVLSQSLELTIEKLQAREKKEAKAAAYHLYSVAQSFKRKDLKNIAEIIFKTMEQKDLAQEENVFQAFELALISLSNGVSPDNETIDAASELIYNVIRKNIPV